MNVQVLLGAPWPWWLTGTLIGLFVPFFYFIANMPLGVSTGYGNFCKMAVPHTKLAVLNTKAYQKIFTWRTFFIIGIFLGAVLASILSGDYSIAAGMDKFSSTVTPSLPLSALWFLTGGLCLGFGARLGHGCTSAHTINGIPNLASSGFVASSAFFAGAVLIVNLVYRVIF